MPDWTASMQQTFEYYIVDPITWKDTKRLWTVKKSSINRDLEADTLGSATIDITGTIDECYVRIYMVTIQNGVEEKHAMGTYLVQTPGTNFDGKITDSSVDAYTPLIELKENPTPIGYYVEKSSNIINKACSIIRDNARAPVVVEENSVNTLIEDDFVAGVNEKWLVFTRELLANAKYELGLDEFGRILFLPIQDTASLQPVYTFNDDNSSILYPQISVDRDMYDIPNVVEVVYTNGAETITSVVTNDNVNSPVSTVARGRKLKYRDTSPNLTGSQTKDAVDEYAKRLLRSLSTLVITISYTHAYVPVRPGDCVRLNYARAGLIDVKAKIISQDIDCVPGCPVTEKAVVTTRLWGD